MAVQMHFIKRDDVRIRWKTEYTFVANLQYMAHGSLCFKQNLLGTEQVFNTQRDLLFYES